MLDLRMIQTFQNYSAQLAQRPLKAVRAPEPKVFELEPNRR